MIIKKTIILILTLTLLMMFLQGCEQDRRAPINIYTGTRGIEIDFLKNAPPDNVFEKQPMNVMVEVWNRGAYSPRMDEDIIMNLRYDPIYFEVDKELTEETLLGQDPTGRIGGLSGKSQEWPQGERIIMPLQTLDVKQILGTREMPTTLLETTVCYPYKTTLTQTICLDTDIYEVDSNPTCRNRGAFTFSGQGAPIVINRIEVDMIPKGIEETPSRQIPIRDEEGNFIEAPPGQAPLFDVNGLFSGLQESERVDRIMLIEPVIRIYARNSGRGDVFIGKEGATTYNLCTMRDESFKYRDHNKIELTRAMLDGANMTCSKTVLNLAHSQDFITCRLSEEQTGYLTQNLQVQLTLEFSYHYRESSTKQVRLLRE